MHFLQQLVERFLVIRQLHVRLVWIWFRGLGDRAGGRLIERFRARIDACHLEGRRLAFLHPERDRRLEAGAIKEEAKEPVEREGNDEADEEPVARFARGQTRPVRARECER